MTAPCGVPPVGRPMLQTPQDVLLEPPSEQVEHASICYPCFHPFHQLAMRNAVEAALEVGVHHKAYPALSSPSTSRNASLQLRPVEIRSSLDRTPPRRPLNHELDRRLDDAVLDRAGSPVVASCHRLSECPPVSPLRPITSFRSSRLSSAKYVSAPAAIRSTLCPSTPAAPLLPRTLPPADASVSGRVHLVHQTVPLASLDAVHQRRHHALRPHRGFHPRSSRGLLHLVQPLRALSMLSFASSWLSRFHLTARLPSDRFC